MRSNQVLGFAAVLAFAATAPFGGGASARSLQSIYSFCQPQNCIDGKMPMGGVILDSSDNIYGTTSIGGAHNHGVIFELVANGDKTAWSYSLLYSFCGKSSCTDGDSPQGSLIQDVNGTLYGVTSGGGKNAHGTIFTLAPNKQHTSWKFKSLFSFCPNGSCSTTGGGPTVKLTYAGEASGVPYDGTSPLYGTTEGGGAHGSGVAYSLAPGKKNKWKQTVIHDFCSLDNCGDGDLPTGELSFDANGSLYGVTFFSGGQNAGNVYRLAPKHKNWVFTDLFDFQGTSPSPTGLSATGGMIFDSAGNLYGTTSNGGPEFNGVLYKLTPDGKQYTQTILYNFCSLSNCADGGDPYFSTLVMDSTGVLFGTGRSGGNSDFFSQPAGVIYSFDPSVSQEKVIYKFCGDTGCKDGAHPSNVVMDAAGNLFGTTLQGGRFGGSEGAGTVFMLKN
jgi:uncharacterized repeat protein (TIGR03803 family)